MLRKDYKTPKQLQLNEAATKAFENLKNALSRTITLTHISTDPLAKLILTTGVSKEAEGAVLQQTIQGERLQRLQPAQTRCSTFGQESLAVYLVGKHLQYLLESRDFALFIGHKPLTFALQTAILLEKLVNRTTFHNLRATYVISKEMKAPTPTFYPELQ